MCSIFPLRKWLRPVGQKKLLTRDERRFCVREGMRIYAAAQAKLERENWGEYVAINVMSGEYVVEKSLGDVARTAEQKFDNALTYLVRIGEPLQTS